MTEVKEPQTEAVVSVEPIKMQLQSETFYKGEASYYSECSGYTHNFYISVEAMGNSKDFYMSIRHMISNHNSDMFHYDRTYTCALDSVKFDTLGFGVYNFRKGTDSEVFELTEDYSLKLKTKTGGWKLEMVIINSAGCSPTEIDVLADFNSMGGSVK